MSCAQLNENREHIDPFSRENTERGRVVAEIAERMLELRDLHGEKGLCVLLITLGRIAGRGGNELDWTLRVLSGDLETISKTYGQLGEERGGVSRQAIHQELKRVRASLETISPSVARAFGEIQCQRKIIHENKSPCANY